METFHGVYLSLKPKHGTRDSDANPQPCDLNSPATVTRMPRKKPTSTRQKKAEQQLKRAVKRGDAPPPPKEHAKRRRGPNERSALVPSASGVGTKRLESRFLKMDKEWLEHARYVASTTPLLRPIPFEAAVLDLSRIAGGSADDGIVLTAPKRPKWRYDQTKKEVEKNEDGLFARWINEVDESVKRWQQPPVEPKQEDSDFRKDVEKEPPQQSFERSPTYFERNIEVYRQLWRVAEISQIILVLLDSRAPTIHLPTSLTQYLQALRPPPQTIFVLTKVDLVGPERTSAWHAYFTLHHPEVQIIQAESYKERTGVLTDGRGTKKFVDPYIPPTLLTELLSALKLAHKRLLEPPLEVQQDEKKLKHWKPKVRESVDWDAAVGASSTSVAQGVFTATTNPEDSTEEADKRYVTIGLIGQPNVGKSSLLNAIFGAHKVRASRTPGKTKHFQTLFWTPEIRLVDCPGLVFPGLVPMEMQVLAGIIPISQVASIPSCIQFVCEHMPLETIMSLAHPSAKDKDQEDKRTWRVGMEKEMVTGSPGADVAPRTWTATDVMTAYATEKGWLTAKAGRPDMNRAGNAILRACAEGRSIKWGFWPPGTQPNQQREGIWIHSAYHTAEQWEDDSLGSGGEQSQDGDSEVEKSDKGTESGKSGEESEDAHLVVAGGRFGALSLSDGEESE